MAEGGDTDRDWPAVLRTALGVPAEDLDVLSVLPWQPEMLVADQFTSGRVHLAGDAAHVMPPFVASGANTGIADVHNLGWKLAAVLAGSADQGLLASYDAERRPASWFVADQSSRRTLDLRDRVIDPDPTLAHPYVLAAGGFQYREGALALTALDEADPEPVVEFNPAGRIGTRIPHGWLDRDRSLSTLDLSGPGWSILCGKGAQLPYSSGSTMDALEIHSLDVDFLPSNEFLLLRPDHIIAWRGTGPSMPERIRSDLLSGRQPASV